MSELTPDERAELRDLQRKLFGGEHLLEAGEADRYRQLSGRHADPREVGEPAVTREQVKASEQQTPADRSGHPGQHALTGTQQSRLSPNWLRRLLAVPPRERIKGVLVGAGAAAAAIVLTLAVQYFSAPRPVFSGEAVPVASSELPGGVEDAWAIGADTWHVSGWQDDIWIMQAPDHGYGCVVTDLDSESADSFPQVYCSGGRGALVVDIWTEIDHRADFDVSQIDPTMAYRAIFKDGTLTLWDAPPTSRDHY